ncbi:MAG: hypothetical protein ACKVTZ_09980 [Bacteroidia bacterium]
MNKVAYIIPSLLLLGVFGYFMVSSNKKPKDVVSVAQFEGWRNTKLSVNNKLFTISFPKEYVSIHRDTLAWTAKMPKDKMQGVLVTIMEKGKEVAMGSPFVQVAYFSKKNPGCSTIDSVLFNLNKMMKNNPSAQITKEVFNLPSVSGRPVYCEYIHLDKREFQGKEFHEQYYAYAYLEHTADYWITMTLSTTSKTEFADWEPRFHKILESYRD